MYNFSNILQQENLSSAERFLFLISNFLWKSNRTWKCQYHPKPVSVRWFADFVPDTKATIHTTQSCLEIQITDKIKWLKVRAPCSLSPSEMVIFSPEIKNSYNHAIITKIATEVMDSWLFPTNMSCNAPQIHQPWLYVVRLLLCLFKKSMTYGLKATDAVVCLLIAIFSPETACIFSSPTVFGQNCVVWALPSSIPHLSSSHSSLEIKLLEKARVTARFVCFIYFHMIMNIRDERKEETIISKKRITNKLFHKWEF